MRTITFLALVFAIALGLWVFVPGLAWQADAELTRAQKHPSPPTKQRVVKH